MNSLSLPVIHPAFQNLKRNGRLLHILAGGLIITHAISHYRQPEPSTLYLFCLLLIALDIFILVFAVKNILTELPRVNLFFRLVEGLFFLGIGLELLLAEKWWMGAIHISISLAYAYLFYCEMKINKEEFIGIHHTGISIPALPDSRFFIWSHIQEIEAGYSTVTIHTSHQKSFTFQLAKNLQFEELDQIHEFCRHYLGASPKA